MPAAADLIDLIVFGAAPDAAWRSAVHEAGFAWQAAADVAALHATLRRTGDAVCGVLLDLRTVDDADRLQALAAELAAPRLRSLCVHGSDAPAGGALFDLTLRYCVDSLAEPVQAGVLKLALDSLHRRLRLLRAARARVVPAAARAGPGGLLGDSVPMRRLRYELEKVAASDVPVFISGETGVGKEVAARAIHDLSPRRAQPFVAINCGAIPPHLLQSELFGYEKGAFTGASQRRIGRIETASGGTLLLDEIGDLPADAQVGLLRFLQEGRIERLGGTASIAVDVRVLSATHVDLLQAQHNGQFRTDLYHRLCVVEIGVPPLRARGDDIVLLAGCVLDLHRREASRRVVGFTDAALHALRAHAWPGNVRELINRVRRALVMCEGERIDAADLGLTPPRTVDAPGGSLEQVRDQAIGRAINSALERNQNTVVRAADELGVSRATLYRLMERHGITPDSRHRA